MATEDKLEGAKNAFTFYYAYINAVGQEIGMERAAALSTQVDETMGAMLGRKMKEHAGLKEFDVKTAITMAVNAIREGFGITSEVIEDSPNRAVVRCGRCPVYEAAQIVGMDAETIENLCRTGSISLMDAMVKQLNPKLSYQLRKFRSGPDDFCEEEISLG